MDESNLLPKAKRSNVLMIVMDDQRADTLAGFPGPRPSSPNLDALVAQGTSFRNTFVNVPICTPGRAELLTGCNAFENGVLWFGEPINPERTLLPVHFRDHGYETFAIGKWHNDGHPRERGFNRTRRIFNSENLNDYSQHGHTLRFNEDGREVEGHSSVLLTDAAIEEIAAAPQESPWLCYLAYHSPHDPFDAPPPFDTLYDPDTVPLPENFSPMPPVDNGDLTIRDELLLPWPRTQEAIRRYRARYWQMIAHHDHEIGRLLSTLKAQGHLENTLIVFVSDHGLAVGSHGLLGKENMYDHSCRVPWVLAGPGVPQGRFVDELVTSHDLFPTVCELCEIPIPPSVTGRSHAGGLAEGLSTGREFIVNLFCSPGASWGAMRETQRAIRTQKWKLTFYPQSGCYELFDLRADALELDNLLAPWRLAPATCWSFERQHPVEKVLAVAEGLRARLLQWQEAYGDPAREALLAAPIPKLEVCA